MVLLLIACAGDDRLALSWNPDGPTTPEQTRDGVLWALSHLGATPDEDAVEVDASDVFISRDVHPRFDVLEARARPDLDVGRFLLDTLHDAGTYYVLTDACSTLDGFRARSMDAEPLEFAVTASLFVDGHRSIERNDAVEPLDLGFVAAEGPGSVFDGTFEAHEHEVIDYMPNGQQRYAVYDSQGRLSAGATVSPAGHPGKCAWCHEGNLQVLDPDNEPTPPPALDNAAWLAMHAASDEAIATWRGELDSTVPWTNRDAHTWMEHLVEAVSGVPFGYETPPDVEVTGVDCD